MVDVNTQNKTISVNVSSSGVSSNVNASGNASYYYSEKAREWAISNRIVDGVDYSSKYYAGRANQSALNAQSFAQSAQDSYNNFQQSVDGALSTVNDTVQGAITTIDTKSGEAVETINNTVDSAVENIDIEANKQIDNIERTGFYMRDDKLYFINSEGKEQKFNPGGAYVGQTIFSLLPLNEASLHLLNGTVLDGNGIYKDFVDYIAELYNADPTANYFAQPHGEIAWVQPIATGSTTAITGGDMVITSSNSYSGYDAWKAMDGVYSGTTATTGWGTNNTSANQWWQLKLPYQIRITGLKGYQRYDTTPTNANTIGRFYTSSDMTTPIGDTYTNASGKNWNAVEVSGIPEEGIVTDTIYFQKTGGGNYGGLGELVITATVVGSEKTAEQVWQTSVSNYGVCGKFVYNSSANTVRLPKVTGILEGTIDANALGDLVEAGLPAHTHTRGTMNITGSFDNSGLAYEADAPTGAFYTKATGQPSNQNRDNVGYTYGFKASRSWTGSTSTPNYTTDINTTSTVQPQTIKGYYYIVVATSTKTDIEVDIDNVVTDLNGKADTDLNNVTDTAKVMISGYSLPSNKFINLTLGASGTTYTAPANGWITLRKIANSDGSAGDKYIDIYNRTSAIAAHNNGAYSFQFICTIPALKGDIIQINYNATGKTILFRFIYAEGNK